MPFARAEHVANEAPHAELMAIANGEHVSLFTHLNEVRARTRDFLT